MSNGSTSRRDFLQSMGFSAAALGLAGQVAAQEKKLKIPGFEEAPVDPNAATAWKPVNMTVCGIVASQSALNDGERLKVPHYTV